ncbi:MAG: hypothetical protein WC856_02270 [Methylococcaceae bacterium]|jgi:hypothetical protein
MKDIENQAQVFMQQLEMEIDQKFYVLQAEIDSEFLTLKWNQELFNNINSDEGC